MVCSLLLSCNLGGADPAPVGPSPVRVVTVGPSAEGLSIRATGRLASRSEVRRSFKIGGLLERLADEGEAVAAGQLLARLDRSEIAAEVSRVGAVLEQAQRDLRRAEILLESGSGSEEGLQRARTALSVAESNARVAAFSQQHSEIRAQSSGRILRRLAEPGEFVAAGQPVMLLGTDSGWVVRVGLTDREVVRLQHGDRARIRFDAHPGKALSAEVTEIGEVADPATGTFEVEVTLDPTEHALKSGFIASVGLETQPPDPPLYMVPIEALVSADGDRGVVFRVSEEGTAQRTEVGIAGLWEDHIAVNAGLQPDTRVVVEGGAYLTEGAAVALIE